MKELINVGNGALVISEEGGNIKIAISKKASLSAGGGDIAGIVTVEGEVEGAIVVKGKVGFDAGMKLLEAHSPPALVPIEEGARELGDSLIDKA